MSDRVTYGYSESLVEVDVTPTEPITLAEVKTKLNIDFTAHDTEIGRLITSVRMAVEKKYSKSFTGKTVSVLWESFYDSLPLPYGPLADVPALTATDLDDIAIDSSLYSAYKVGNNYNFKGDFPNGVKLQYTTQALSDNYINELLMEAVGSCLEQDMTVAEAIQKHFRNATI